MTLGLIDILFLITLVLLVFQGLRNGFVFSIVNLVSIPLGLAAAYVFGPQLTKLLAQNGLSATPFISYAVVFLGTVLILHIVGGLVRGVIRRVPIISQGDALLGGAIGFVEAWLLWLFLLIILGTFLGGAQAAVQQGAHMVPGLDIHFDQLKAWHDFYNQALTNSLFAKLNGLFVKQLPALPQPPNA